MTAILNLFKSAETIRAERIAAWKAEEARMKRHLERAMRNFGVLSQEARDIEREMNKRERMAYAA